MPRERLKISTTSNDILGLQNIALLAKRIAPPLHSTPKLFLLKNLLHIGGSSKQTMRSINNAVLISILTLYF